MKLFRLTIDFTFKAVFGKNPDLLMDMLNSFPQFQGNKQIKSLTILNPEIPKELTEEKLSILDIKAEDLEKSQFIIEMQAFPQSEFPKRALYYWAKSYSRNLGRGYNYDKLKKVYSFNFLNFILFKESHEYISTFELQEKTRKTSLTDDLEINIIELPKFIIELGQIKNDLDYWIYLLKESDNLKGETMKTLEKKNPKIKKAITELKILSLDKKSRELYESRLKAELDYNTNINSALKKGREEGIQIGEERGREEALYLGIQLGLETRFNSKGLALLPSIKKIKDLEKLKKILEATIKAPYLEEIKLLLSKL